MAVLLTAVIRSDFFLRRPFLVTVLLATDTLSDHTLLRPLFGSCCSTALVLHLEIEASIASSEARRQITGMESAADNQRQFSIVF